MNKDMSSWLCLFNETHVQQLMPIMKIDATQIKYKEKAAGDLMHL